MTDHIPDDLEPAGRDLREYTDELRRSHPIVRNARREWVLLRHADVVAAANDPETFSSAVSRNLHIPNGLDGDHHRHARDTIDSYFSPAAIAPFEPVFRSIARDLVKAARQAEWVDAVSDLGARFAVRAQSQWLGWPAELEPALLRWMRDNHAASRSGDHTDTNQVAADFDDIIRSILQPRRAQGDEAPDDLTTQLMSDTMGGRSLSDDELVSILRNWTGGDLGSIALCVGVVVAFLADHPDIQAELRDGASEADLDAAIDEMLRIDDPFIANRRRTTRPVHIAGVEIPAGEVVKLHWTSANRDEAVFGDPDRYDPVANAPHNVVYGTGPHVCPGRPLATLQLRVAVQELLAATTQIIWAPGQTPQREVTPLGGWHSVPVSLR